MEADVHQKSREKILAAATEEFGREGYTAASTNRVCRCAQISKGLLFHYYCSKRNLFFAVLERCLDQTEADAPPSGEKDPCANCCGQFAFFLAHPFHHRILSEMLEMDPQGDPAVLALRERTRRLRTRLFEPFLKDSPLRPGADPELAEELLCELSGRFQKKYLDAVSRGQVSKTEAARLYAGETREWIRMVFYGMLDRTGDARLMEETI